ncbi:hypothetical protein Srot_1427 [Segniliparus rotundus DSM 44985]|uniref:Uncharacterized protein n=1 Tax=Segniliparus rotundus (strain ATCC BAA-972 / CDC 1076 / CIP 108378 / DSM 44985 / JCM 13578) TaxID=640132 RepID=D6Z7G0_SEGRD|nr:hypothetical protein Srot_1427 [Segniliparus rotundus DSM 44985]
MPPRCGFGACGGYPPWVFHRGFGLVDLLSGDYAHALSVTYRRLRSVMVVSLLALLQSRWAACLFAST